MYLILAKNAISYFTSSYTKTLILKDYLVNN